MNDAKIQLSEDELLLALNAEMILTKNRIIHKVYQLFGQLADHYRQHAASLFSFLPVIHPPKIARGENYNGLPYVMLDYPRYFTHSDILAIRTMFWWGNDMSITLHLKGQYKERFGPGIVERLRLVTDTDWYIQTSGNEWQHEYNGSTHTIVNATRSGQVYRDVEMASFLKLSSYLSIKKWSDAEAIFTEKFKKLIGVIADQLPKR